MHTRLALAALFAALLAAPAGAHYCPFCAAQGQTLLGELNQADFILFGTLKNAKPDPDDPSQGTTDVVIESVIKDHPFLAGLKDKKVMTIPRYVPPQDAKTKHLIFCSVYAPTTLFPISAVGSGLVMANWAVHKVDPYHGLPVLPESKVPEYLKGVQEIKDKDPVERLRFFFNYLESPEVDISNDAYLEFGQADYKDVRAVAEKLPPGTVLKWIKDPGTLSLRLGLYGLMAGHTGSADDAKALRAIIDDPNRQYASGLDGLICGYIMLDKKNGWDYLTKLLKDNTKDFTTRYAGIRVIRFFWEYRPDHVSKDEVLEALKIPLSQPDVADLPIEDLRKWKQWQLAGTVLEMVKKEKHAKEPLVVRATTRFFLAAPADTAGAAEFIAQRRKADPDGVKDIEELLSLEKAAAEPNKAEAGAGHNKEVRAIGHRLRLWDRDRKEEDNSLWSRDRRERPLSLEPPPGGSGRSLWSRDREGAAALPVATPTKPRHFRPHQKRKDSGAPVPINPTTLLPSVIDTDTVTRFPRPGLHLLRRRLRPTPIPTPTPCKLQDRPPRHTRKRPTRPHRHGRHNRSPRRHHPEIRLKVHRLHRGHAPPVRPDRRHRLKGVPRLLRPRGRQTRPGLRRPGHRRRGRYLTAAAKLDPKDSAKALAFFFKHLESKDPTVAADAFTEFARATDAEIAAAAKHLDRAKLRAWLADQGTPAERLGVYAMMLGLAGQVDDAPFLRSLLNQSPLPERLAANLGGLLAGYTLLDPKAGWTAVETIFADPQAAADRTFAAVGVARFFQATRPKEAKPMILAAYKTAINKGGAADMAIEDLRRWQWWDLTAEILSSFDKKTHAAPITRRAIVRYALSSPDKEAKTFLTKVRSTDAKLVEEVEEGLKLYAVPGK